MSGKPAAMVWWQVEGQLAFVTTIVGLVLLLAMLAVIFRPATYGAATCRRIVHDRWNRALFVSLPITWIVLIPWAMAFGPSGLYGGHNPPWVGWPIVAVLAGFPAIGALLIARAKGARGPSATYVVLNIPFWLMSCAVADMAATGNWI